MTDRGLDRIERLFTAFGAPFVTAAVVVGLALGFGLVTPAARLTRLEAIVASNATIQDSLLRLGAAQVHRSDVQTKLWCLAFQQSAPLRQLAALICNGVDIPIVRP